MSGIRLNPSLRRKSLEWGRRKMAKCKENARVESRIIKLYPDGKLAHCSFAGDIKLLFLNFN